MSQDVRIQHASIYAGEPEKAALNLALLTGGVAKPFHPWEGAWVCFLNEEDWSGPLIEFYPHDVTLAQQPDGSLALRAHSGGVKGAGTHFNITLPKTREQLERQCNELNLKHAWRDWAGFLDVWLENELLFECVPDKP